MGRLVKQDRAVGKDSRKEQTDWGDRLNRTVRLGRLVEQDYPVSQDILVIVYYRHILDWIHRVEFLQKPIKNTGIEDRLSRLYRS